MKIKFIFFILCFSQLVLAQQLFEKVHLTLRYPSGNTDLDEITFETVQPVLHEDVRLPYRFYELKKQNWLPGQIFQLVVEKNTLPSGYYYVFGVDAGGALSIYYPVYSPADGITEDDAWPAFSIIPSPRRGINLARPGVHQFCVLFSSNPIKDWQSLITLIKNDTAVDFQKRVLNTVGDRVLPPSEFVYTVDTLGFTVKQQDIVVPLFLNVNCLGKKEPEPEHNLYILSVGAPSINLQYTQNDAMDIASLFAQKGKAAYKEVMVETLTGEAATVKNICRSLENLTYKRQIDEKDVILLFISSNGFLHNDELFIQGADHDPANPRETSLNYYDLYRILKKSPAQKVVLLDLSASQATEKNEPVVFTSESPIKPLPENNIFTIFSNCKGEYSWEDAQWQNGAFTEAILEALSGKADLEKDGIIKLSELYKYVSDHTSEMVRTVKGKSQTPVLPRPEFVDMNFFEY